MDTYESVPPRTPQPGDHCRFLPFPHVEHTAPCPEGHATGTITDTTTGKVVKRP